MNFQIQRMINLNIFYIHWIYLMYPSDKEPIESVGKPAGWLQEPALGHVYADQSDFLQPL